MQVWVKYLSECYTTALTCYSSACLCLHKYIDEKGFLSVWWSPPILWQRCHPNFILERAISCHSHMQIIERIAHEEQPFKTTKWKRGSAVATLLFRLTTYPSVVVQTIKACLSSQPGPPTWPILQLWLWWLGCLLGGKPTCPRSWRATSTGLECRLKVGIKSWVNLKPTEFYVMSQTLIRLVDSETSLD